MPGSTDRVNMVVRLLAAEFGQPRPGSEDVAQWALTPSPDGMPVHLACEALENGGCARIWIFDPAADTDGQVRCLRVVTPPQAQDLLAELRRRLDRAKRRPPPKT